MPSWENILPKVVPEGTRRISSDSTFYYKRIFPILWFGFTAFLFVVCLVALVSRRNESNPPPPSAIFVPIGMALFGFFYMMYFFWNLVDEVLDAGDVLIVRNKSIEERVLFTNILNIDHASSSRPPRVTLRLREAGIFGNKIAFLPPPRSGFFGLGQNPIINDLIARVNATKSELSE